MKPIFCFFCIFNFFCLSTCLGEKDSATENFCNKSESHPDKDKDKDDDKCKGKDEAAATEQPPPIGNLSLPPSQQPSVLVGFGGNIINKGEVQLSFFADGYFGHKKVQTDIYPTILFGVTDTFSILFTFPYAPINEEHHHYSSGLRDCFVQLEYAFYNKSTYEYFDQATLVGNISFPTGSSKKNPHTGFGAAGFFLGATYSRSTIDWFVFAAPGALLTATERRTKFGDQFYYQFGFGKNIPSPPEWIYAWIIEIDGQYNRKDRIKGKIDNNSGGNTIFATPSIWISSREMLFQFGLSFPLNQNLFGKQGKFQYGFNLNFAWSFY